MYNSKGEIVLNRWGEIKFIAPEGAHRCRIQVEKWLANPNIPFAEIACYGVFYPRLNHMTEEGRQKIFEYGE